MEWIKTTDRLPEKYVRVLVSDGKIVCEAYRRKRDGQWTGWTCLSDEYLDDITLWMPHPKPPTT